MSKEKLIDLLKDKRRLDDITQMAKVIEITEQIARDAHCGYPSPRMMATDLYEKGYRKQRVGEWIDAKYYIHNKQIYKCSECSKSEAKDALTSANYCPNCGAKMKGGAG